MAGSPSLISIYSFRDIFPSKIQILKEVGVYYIQRLQKIIDSNMASCIQMTCGSS